MNENKISFLIIDLAIIILEYIYIGSIKKNI
jgi:hypothetical protein